jgi:hypothetical protein
MRLLDPGVLLFKDIVGTFLLLLNPPRCDNARGIEDAFISRKKKLVFHPKKPDV